MQIKTKEDVHRLKERIQSELGIDVSSYSDKEMAEKILDLVVFPKYVLNWVIRPILIAIILYVAGFFFLDLVHVEYVIYGLAGLGLFLITGFSSGLLLFVQRIKEDLWKIIQFVLEILGRAYEDVSNVNNSLDGANRKEHVSLLFQRVIHVVVLPVLTATIPQKLPVVGWVVSRFLRRIFTVLANKFEPAEMPDKLGEKEVDTPRRPQSFKDTVSSSSKILENILSVAIKIVSYPIVLAIVVSFFLLAVFLYLIH